MAVVGASATVARWWAPGRGAGVHRRWPRRDPATDFERWAPRVAPGGRLVIHDVFPDPADGGRPPYEVFCRGARQRRVRGRRRWAAARC
ncbi:MAG: hypothetical protein R2755_04225 [Acidimicrobiales bacterium]